MRRRFPRHGRFWLLGVVALVAAAEVVARLLLPGPLAWRQPQLRFRADPELIFALVPEQTSFTADEPVSINALGLRGPLVPRARPDGTLRILVLGDSVAFGFGVSDANVLGVRAARRLGDAGIAAEAVNAGVPSYNLAQAIQFLDRECERYSPDWVAAVLSWNDFSDKSGVSVAEDGRLLSAGETQPPGARWTTSPRAYAVRNTLKQSRLLYAARRLFASPPRSETAHRQAVLGGHSTAEIERGWREFNDAVADLARVSARCRTRPVILALPFRSLLEGQHPNSTYPLRARQAAESHAIPIIDLEPEFRRAVSERRPLFLPYDEDHPNAAGHDLAAQALARFVIRHAADGPPLERTARLKINVDGIRR